MHHRANLSTAFCTILLGLVFVAQSHAQPSASQFPQSGSHTINLPLGDPGAGQPFLRSVAGELTGDHIIDVVYLRGTQPGFLFGPVVYQARTLFPQTANDLDLFPGVSPEGADGVVLVHQNGAEIWTYDTALDQLSPTFPLDSRFAGSARILVADIDGSGTSDLVAVASDQVTIDIHLSPIQSPQPGPMVEAAIVTAAPILDVTILDWSDDSPGDLEIAVLTEDGLFVYTRSGTLVWSLNYSVARGVIESFRQEGRPFDRIAAIIDLDNGVENDHFIVVDRDGLESTTVLGPVHVVGITAGDVDSDNLDDLAIRFQGSERIAFYPNLADPSDLTAKAFVGPFQLIDTGLGDIPAPGVQDHLKVVLTGDNSPFRLFLCL